jgi:RNA polymerase sigma-70 factor (ECF subfamily)
MGTMANITPSQKDRIGEIETIMAEHETALLRYATRMLNDPSAAQDVVQDSFIKLFKSFRDGSNPAEKISGWLYRVTHNLAVDYIRRENRLRWLHKKHADEMPLHGANTVAPAVNESETTQLVLTQVHKLPEAERQVVILRLQEGLPYKEIAAITGRTEGNVGCILHHAVKKIASGLKKSGALST